MNKGNSASRISLFSEREKPQSDDIYVYGSEKTADKEQDTFAAAFDRYLNDSGMSGKRVSPRKLSLITGISKSTISNYEHGLRQATYDNLCAICIGLRLHPMRQRHFFCKSHFMIPTNEPYPDKRDKIIRSYLDACAFQKEYTVRACNDELIANGCEPLTCLNSEQEDKQ